MAKGRKVTNIYRLYWVMDRRQYDVEQEPCYQAVKEAFLSDTAQEFFCCEKILKLLDEHKQGIRDNSRKIWTVYMFLVWHKVYFFIGNSDL